MDHILSIDQGTTSSRAVIFDEIGTPINMVQQEFSQHFPYQGWVEHDPIELIHKINQMLNVLFKTFNPITIEPIITRWRLPGTLYFNPAGRLTNTSESLVLVDLNAFC